MKIRHQDLLKQMTLSEKAALLSGGGEWESRRITRLNLPSFIMSDGPHGVRRQAGAGDHLGLNASLPATCFPTAATVANSWDPDLGEKIGQALGEEAAQYGVGVLLGPGLNIKRSPLCGRNFEYFSEDPYLAGKMAAGYIRGIQSNGIYACPKHFAVNSQETRRMAMDAVLDERTLREIYLTGFEIAVKEGNPHAIMSAYNQVNGVYANENAHLLKEILREEWGFDGIAISDWGASNDHVEGVKNGADLEMPGCGFDSTRELVRAVRKGRLSEEALDERVDGILEAMLRLGGMKKNVRSENIRPENVQSGAESADTHAASASEWQEHHQLARRAAAESAVLLRNEDGILPLAKGTKVAVIGDFAFTPRYQGAGSSLVNATQVDTIVSIIPSYTGTLEVLGMAQGYQRIGGPDADLRQEALKLAKDADVVLFFFGLDEVSESEGGDRENMRIPQNQEELLRTLYQVNQRIVGVISAGSPVEMPWETCCAGLLQTYLTGQAGAGAVLDILTGKVNPSGKLNETYPLKYEDTPAFHYFPAKQRTSEYRESVFVGYRYYQTRKVKVRYPFGFGLSYTTFAYSDLKVMENGVSVTVTNTGKTDGAEVVQMYVTKENPEVFRPEEELKGFRKIFLKAGEAKDIFLPFDDKTFRYWNVRTGRWEEEAGAYEIRIGASCEDIRLTGFLTREGTGAGSPYDRARLDDYYSGSIAEIPDAEYEALLNRPIPDGSWSGKIGFNDAFCQLYYARSLSGRLVYHILHANLKRAQKKGIPDLNAMFIYNMPFRAMAKMTAGFMNTQMAKALVSIFNLHPVTGILRFIAGFFMNITVNLYYRIKVR